MNTQVLDPISSMCKLGLLKFIDDKTKLSISDHVLYLDTPSTLQWVVRRFHRDTQENISDIFMTIYRIINWYLVPDSLTKNDASKVDEEIEAIYNLLKNGNRDNVIQMLGDSETVLNNMEIIDQLLNDNENKTQVLTILKEMMPNNENHILTDLDKHIYSQCAEIGKSQEFRELVGYMCDGLECLQKTYESGKNVVFTIQYYINLLTDALNGVYNPSRIPKTFNIEEFSYKSCINYNKIKGIWDISAVKGVYQHFVQADYMIKNKQEPTSHINAVKAFLNDSDTKFRALLASKN